MLQFDPAQNKYIRPARNYQWPNLLRGAQTPRHSVYNPVTDEIIMMGQDGGSGNFALRMNVQTGVWTRDDGLASDAIDGSYINDAQATHEQLALDVEHQWMYWIDTYHKQDPDRNHRFRLMRYDITHHNMVTLGWISLPDFGDWLKFPFYKEPFRRRTEFIPFKASVRRTQTGLHSILRNIASP